MNPASDTGTGSIQEPPGPGRQENQTPHANWREALMALIAARIALIQLESKAAAKEGGKRVGLIAAASACAFFAWALLLAGGVSLMSKASGWPMDLVSIIAAVLHLLVGIILFKMAKPSDGSPFPNTRAEFQKDREWIVNFNKATKSKD
jgi:Putative Actinobacterial Holin-X, holin superfamily III